jgi:predicted acyl esterase
MPIGRGSIGAILGVCPEHSRDEQGERKFVYPALMVKGWLAAAAAGVALLLQAGSAGAATEQELSIAMDDGVTLAATLSLPEGAPPSGGWPAIVFLHGLSGKRQDMNLLANRAGFVGRDYAVLTFDARGHGMSTGLVSIDGPREVADTRRVFEWLRDRPDVADGRIGAWGISYGGGAIWNSLAAGVPWAAVEVVETWTDLYRALVPQGLVKSGLVAGLAGSIPTARKSPELDAVQAAALAGKDLDTVAGWASARSSAQQLGRISTPVFLMQGRRDFLFPIDQAVQAFARLQGPKRLWIGNHGHAPSSFPAADTAAMLREGREWFDRFLRDERNGVERRPPVTLAVEGKATTRTFRTLPRTDTSRTSWTAVGRTIEQRGKVVLRTERLPGAAEVFGAPTIRPRRVRRGAGRGSSPHWSRGRPRASRSWSRPGASLPGPASTSTRSSCSTRRPSCRGDLDSRCSSPRRRWRRIPATFSTSSCRCQPPRG